MFLISGEKSQMSANFICIWIFFSFTVFLQQIFRLANLSLFSQGISLFSRFETLWMLIWKLMRICWYFRKGEPSLQNTHFSEICPHICELASYTIPGSLNLCLIPVGFSDFFFFNPFLFTTINLLDLIFTWLLIMSHACGFLPVLCLSVLQYTAVVLIGSGTRESQ